MRPGNLPKHTDITLISASPLTLAAANGGRAAGATADMQMEKNT